MVLAYLVVTLVISYFVYPVFVGMGGMFKFFAATLVIGIYTGVLAAAFRIGRPKPA